MVKVAVFASGNGSNFQKLVDSQRENIHSEYKIEILITDKKDAGVLEKAEKLGISAFFINPKNYENRSFFEKDLVKILHEKQIELIALAGYMRIIGTTLLENYENKIINIHPAYLPEFPGKNGIEDAYLSKADQTGVTIHYVDSGIDTGKIIYQQRVVINRDQPLSYLEKNIHKVEHHIYPMILNKICENL
ncbi:MAG: phosphoribosylglycinamide formyltransferase [Fusobacteriaceae bacterium]